MNCVDKDKLPLIFAKAINEFEDTHVPISEVAIKIGQTIQKLPTADVAEVKHGKWINAYISGVHHYRCTNCGEYIEATWTSNFDYNYCPNCGADMRGGRTE